MIGLFLAAIAATAPIPALIYFETGNSLLANCQGGDVGMNECMGYVSGVVDQIELLQAALGPKAYNVCLPNGVTKGQLADVTAKYLRDNPATRQNPAANLVFKGMAEAFPCSK